MILQKLRKVIAAAAIVLISVSHSSCASTDIKVGDYSCDDIVKSYFYGKSTNARISDFSNHPLPKQYAIFICGNQVMHPPATYLARPLAYEGKKIADFLHGKLLEANDDLTVRDIILIFSEMRYTSGYAPSSNPQLIQDMGNSVRKMKSSGWKKVAEDMLRPMLPK